MTVPARRSEPTRGAGSQVLAIDRVRVAYPDGPDTRVILDDVDLSVTAGELVVLTGPSGAGKSTLLTVAGLLRRPDSGEVTVAGTPTAGLSQRQRTRVRRDHVAFVYQSANLLPSLTAIEQLELVGHIHGEKASGTTARARSLLERVDLAGRADQLPVELSGGERQRVGIARALMASPSLLIADEPTASLDPERAGAVVELISEVTRSEGLATIVVAHDAWAEMHVDRRLHLDRGRLSEVGPPAGAAAQRA